MAVNDTKQSQLYSQLLVPMMQRQDESNSSTALVEQDDNSLLYCTHDAIYNVTEQVPITYARVMYGSMMPVLLAITILSNTLIIIILTRRHMKTPTNLVLLWLAIVDLCTLLAPGPFYFYMYTLGYHGVLLSSAVQCYVYNAMTYHVPMMFHTASIWLTTLLAGQR